MALTLDLRDKLRWNWNLLTYVVQTEGPQVAVERALGLAGLAAPHIEPEETLVAPPGAPLSLAAAARWPVSLIVFGGAEPGPIARRVLELAAELGVPTRTADPVIDDPGAVELASMLIVAGLENWPQPSVLAEAARLRQTIILLLAAGDVGQAGLPPALSRSQCVVVESESVAAAMGARYPGHPDVRVISPDAHAEDLNQLVLDLGLRVPR